MTGDKGGGFAIVGPPSVSGRRENAGLCVSG